MTIMSFTVSASKQVKPLVNFQAGNLNLGTFFCRKDKVVIVMGATGTGKSRLAIDLATQFPAEIINSDKMQVYKGLDIVTNKVTEEECFGVPHHLLGIVDPNSNFSVHDFTHHASLAIDSIVARDRLPIIAGGSNSHIAALINDHAQFRYRYECCFLWVDVSLPVLHSFVTDRVDRMVKAGMVDEVRNMFDSEADYFHGIRQAIGVPELDEFLRAELSGADDETLDRFLETAISQIKKNTCNLACRQLQKIHRLLNLWQFSLSPVAKEMHRLNATEAFLKLGEESDEAWQKFVAGPSTMIVENFLYDGQRTATIMPSDTVIVPPVPMAAVAAATR